MKDFSFFILAGNAGYYNRGSEAIIRGTVRILREFFDQPRFLVVSHYKNNRQFKRQCLEETDSAITHKRMRTVKKRFDLMWLLTKSLNVAFPAAVKHIVYKDLKPFLGRAQAVLAVGGDNYSMDYKSLPKTCTDLDDLVVEKGKPLVIWAASVGPFSARPRYEKYMADHLRKVHILARETLTIEYLAGLGLTENVHRVADPAFLVEPAEPVKKEGIPEIDAGAVGLNLSPLMSRFLPNGDLSSWTSLCTDIISKILEKTDGRIYLIPHVTATATNDDYLFMKSVLAAVAYEKERVVLIPPVFNAAETKWIIGKMAAFAGARMHSTIAALSCCVPTLSLAYSVKAKGLNQDIYGHTDYCISSDELVPDTIADKIVELLRKSKDIRKHLKSQMPEVRKLAMDSGRILKRILEKSSS
jgi:colanic acid/amylovoran biosynthesis protein